MSDDPMTSSSSTTAADRQTFSDRAKVRLREARILLHNNPVFFGLPPTWKLDDTGGFYEAVLATIAALEAPAREALREHVDWNEGMGPSIGPWRRLRRRNNTPQEASPSSSPATRETHSGG